MPTQPYITAELRRRGALPSHYAKGHLADESDLSLGRDTGSTLPGEITLSTHVPGDEHSAEQSAPSAPLLHTSAATRTSFYCTFFLYNRIFTVTLGVCPMMPEIFIKEKIASLMRLREDTRGDFSLFMSKNKASGLKCPILFAAVLFERSQSRVSVL